MLEEKKEELQQWIKKADGDLKVAKKLYNSEDNEDILWIICFHSQQAIEKYLKAYLIAYGKERIKYTHNLTELLDKCKHSGKLFDKIDREYLDEVSVYAVHGRYPFFTGEQYSADDAKKAIDTAEEVAGLLKTEIGDVIAMERKTTILKIGLFKHLGKICHRIYQKFKKK